MAFERLYGPLGPERADTLTAILAATIANSNRDPESTPVTPDDFMPDWPARWDDEEDEPGGDH